MQIHHVNFPMSLSHSGHAPHPPSRLRDGPGHWDAGRDARTRILGAGIQGPNVFVLLGRVSQLPGIPGHSTGTRIPVVAPSWDDTCMLTGTTSQLTGTQLVRNWDATGTLMLVMILRLTVIAVVLNIVKILSEALRKTVNDMRALVLRSSLDIESNTPTLA